MCGKHDDQGSPISRLPEAEDVRLAISRLTSLSDGDRGLIETVACGMRAVPALRTLVFSREPSGIYETRRRAVEALAQLHAHDVLIDYLREPHAISDPIEQVGEEAVINAAARALARSERGEAVPLLIEWSQGPPLAGIVDALGTFRRAEAIPYFVKALAEDSTRSAAEGAIRKLGLSARDALFQTALRSAPPDEETVSSKRRRRSALKLFHELGSPPVESWRSLRQLMEDDEPSIAATACQICLESGGPPDKVAATMRLIDLFSVADWLLSERIEDCLVADFAFAEPIIRDRLRRAERKTDDATPMSRTVRALRRVASRGRDFAHGSLKC